MQLLLSQMSSSSVAFKEFDHMAIRLHFWAPEDKTNNVFNLFLFLSHLEFYLEFRIRLILENFINYL